MSGRQLDKEVYVVGGGPSGLLSARELNRKERDVLVLEEHQRIGLPDHCSGLFGIEGLKQIGMQKLPDEIVQNPGIYGAKLISPSGNTLIVRKRVPHAIVTDRSAFDREIAKRCQEEGVEILHRSRVLYCQVNKEGVKIKWKAKGKETKKGEGRALIAADGKWGSISKKIGIPYNKRKDMVFGAQYYLENVSDIDTQLVEVYQNTSFARDYFAWLIPIDESRAKIGLASKYVPATKILERFLLHHPIMSSRLRKAKIYKKVTGAIPMRGAVKRTYTDSAVVVGDAAGQTKPTTGGGVILGGICARIAGRVVSQAIDRDDTSANFLSRYEKLWKKQIGSNLRAMNLVRRYMNSLSNNDMDFLFEKLQRNRTIIEELGDVDDQKRIVRRLMTTPNMYNFYLKTGIGFVKSLFV